MNVYEYLITWTAYLKTEPFLELKHTCQPSWIRQDSPYFDYCVLLSCGALHLSWSFLSSQHQLFYLRAADHAHDTARHARTFCWHADMSSWDSLLLYRYAGTKVHDLSSRNEWKGSQRKFIVASSTHTHIYLSWLWWEIPEFEQMWSFFVFLIGWQVCWRER